MKRPWNIINTTVYSLATYANEAVNMNICTYVSAVSMHPKLYMIAIDYHTQTYTHLLSSEYAVLQILHQDHQSLVPLLGKKSGKKTDKCQQLLAKDQLTTWQGHQVLKGACGYLLMKIKKRSNIGGDHEIFYFDVEKSSSRSEDGILTFQDLVQAGIIL